MADADHAIAFWTAVATAYGNQPNVIFDLFNEPFISDWNCWLVGGPCAQDYDGGTYTAVGPFAALVKGGSSAHNHLTASVELPFRADELIQSEIGAAGTLVGISILTIVVMKKIR